MTANTRPALRARALNPATLASIALALCYFVLVLGFRSGPVFEGPDELEHYRYIRTIVQTRALPEPPGPTHGEYYHPPLYYTLSALPLSLMDDNGFEAFSNGFNPHYAYAFDVPGNDNKNQYLHSAASEARPVAHAVYTLRLLPAAFGLGTLAIAQRLFGLVFPASLPKRLLALAFVALHPLYAYMHSVINNDSLLIMLSTLVIYLLLRWEQTGWTWQRAAGLGIVCGLLLLTKTNGAFAVTVAGGWLLIGRGRRWLPLVVAAALLVAGGWYARNWINYRDPLLGGAWRIAWASDVIPNSPDFEISRERVGYAFQNFWARFGSGAVSVPWWLERVWGALAWLAAAGLVVQAVYSLRRGLSTIERPVWQMASFGVAWLAMVFYLSSIAWSGNQGRYLLPGAAVWAAALSGGLLGALPRRLMHFTAVGISIVLLAAALISLYGYFLPAYHPSAAVAAEPVGYVYDDVAQLAGITPSLTRARAGHDVTITLVWRALAEPEMPLKTFLHTILPDGTPTQAIIGRDSYPGTGNLLAQDWRSGTTWAEHYVIRIPRDAPDQQVYLLVAGLYEAETERVLTARDAGGQPVTEIVGQMVIHGPPSDPPESSVRFGGWIGASGAKLTQEADGLRVCVEWAALEDGLRDARRFVHGFNTAGQLVAQDDGVPRGNAYPTQFWLQGEVVEDCAYLTGASSELVSLALGWYDPVTGERLAAQGSDGLILPDGVWRLSRVSP